ncbi:MAG: SCP2 sterol-binding domain-containing protein [Endozoicomonas sp.]
MSDLKNVIETMKSKFSPEAADDLEAVLQFDLEGEKCHALIKEGAIEVVEGGHAEPTVTLEMEVETLEGILEGEQDGMSCFMMGQIQVDGDMILAGQISELFPA